MRSVQDANRSLPKPPLLLVTREIVLSNRLPKKTSRKDGKRKGGKATTACYHLAFRRARYSPNTSEDDTDVIIHNLSFENYLYCQTLFLKFIVWRIFYTNIPALI